MYHRVLPQNDPDLQSIQPGLYVTPEVFEKQVAFLSRRFKVISLGKLSDLHQSGMPIPKNCAVVTFDDGWRDNFENAFPILRRYNIPATVFLATDFIGTNNILWFYLAGKVIEKANIPPDRLSAILRRGIEREASSGVAGDMIEALKALDHESILTVIHEIASEAGIPETDLHPDDNMMLNWEQVAEMSRGGIEIGSHGCSHRILTHLEQAEVKRELTCSKEIIESKLGRKIDIFSYPNGDYDSKIKDLVREAGYALAVATRGNTEDKGMIDIFALKRVGVHQDISLNPNGNFSGAMFAFHISGWSAVMGKR
jgi:peptidoglycan/xylan/chitin deacetylase (PgdA/CDA1 family)